MITPQKHINLNVCVLRIAAYALGRLRVQRIERFSVLLESVKELVGPDAEILFLPAVNLLFLLGRVTYHAHTDTFEYTGPGEPAAAQS